MHRIIEAGLRKREQMSKGGLAAPDGLRATSVLPSPTHLLQPQQDVLPPQDMVGMVLGAVAQEADAKNKQIGRLLDALGMSVAQTRASYERELQTLNRQLDLVRADRDAEKASFEARVSANLQDIRAERDHLRARVRELERARDEMTEDFRAERRRGFLARLFKR